MAFQKNHIDEATRIKIGFGVYFHKGIYGYITEKAREHLVSRWFIYYCYFQFMFLLELIEDDMSREGERYYDVGHSVISLYLDCESSISGIKRAIKSIFGEDISTGKISEIINGYGSSLPDTDSGSRVVLCFVSDEIFANGSPVLVTVDSDSIYILQLRKLDDCNKEVWGECWLEILGGDEEGLEKIVADHGQALVGGIKLVFSEEIYQEDLFHVITHLARLLWTLERKAYSAISKEYEAERLFNGAKSEENLEKRLNAYEEAQKEAEKWIEMYDNFVYLFEQLQEVLQIVDQRNGHLRKKAEVESEICAILELMLEIDYEKIDEGVAYFKNHQDNVLKYFDDLEIADASLKEQIPDEVVRHILTLLYALNSKTHTVYGKRLKILKQKIAFWKDALVDILTPNEFDKLYQIVENKLSKIIRSSSVVENTNSRLRRFFDSARGQINQNRLNLIRFYLNHKVFTRGRRKGYSPTQLFYQQKDKQMHWLDVLEAGKMCKQIA